MLDNDGFETERLIIRPTVEQDLQDLMNWWNDPLVMRSVGFPKGLGMTVERMDEWYAEWVQKYDPSRRHFIITLKKGSAIGEIHYNHLDEVQKSAWIGLKIGCTQYWGQGFAKEAMLGFLRYLFFEHALTAVYLDVRADNDRALRLYQSVGFKKLSTEPADVYEMKISRTNFSL